MNALRLLWVGVLLGGAASASCAAEVERRSDEAAGGATAASASSGEGGTETSSGAGGEDHDDDPRFALCPPPPARPEGLREGTIPSGAPDEAEAAAIFQRASHEVGHLVSAILAEDAGEFQSLFGIEGDVLAASLDGEAVRGTIARDEAAGRTCVALVFGSWTGGHGGWGLSALDGTMELLIDADAVDARGSLGLVESGPLEGAPVAPVTVEYVDETLSGTVGSFSF